MQPRKTALHLVLSRFQVPIELRRIIMEDYFPFLPTANLKMITPAVIQNLLKSNPTWANLLVPYSCKYSILFEIVHKKGVISIEYCLTGYSASNPTSFRCNGACANREKYVIPCYRFQDSALDFCVPKEKILQNINVHDVDQVYRKILSYFRKVVFLLLFEELHVT